VWRCETPRTSIPGKRSTGKPCACSSIASTSPTARWWKPTGLQILPLPRRRPAGSIPHRQEPPGDREPRLQRRQESSRSGAYLSSSGQQSADRLAPHHAGLDHRTTLPPPVSPPWQTPGAQQRPVAAVLVAGSFPTVCCQQQLMHSRKKLHAPFSASDHSHRQAFQEATKQMQQTRLKIDPLRMQQP
jgi:hypothetical protein